MSELVRVATEAGATVLLGLAALLIVGSAARWLPRFHAALDRSAAALEVAAQGVVRATEANEEVGISIRAMSREINGKFDALDRLHGDFERLGAKIDALCVDLRRDR